MAERDGLKTVSVHLLKELKMVFNVLYLKASIISIFPFNYCCRLCGSAARYSVHEDRAEIVLVVM